MEAGGAIEPGQLLISAEPGRGGYFEQSVILLLEHNDNGTLGVCLHQLSSIDIHGPLGHFTDLLTPPATPFEGGPVSQQSAIALAHVANPWEEPPGWRRVFGDVGMLDLDTPVELVRGAYTHLRIFVGLSGWSPGQLEGGAHPGRVVPHRGAGRGGVRRPGRHVEEGAATPWRTARTVVCVDRPASTQLRDPAKEALSKRSPRLRSSLA